MTPVGISDPDPRQRDIPVQIRTSRLTLRPCQNGDGHALADAVAESRAALHPWFHEHRGPRAMETDTTWQERVARRYPADFVFSYRVRHSRHREVSGLEVATALTRYAVGALHTTRVTATCAASTHASMNLITKLGIRPICRAPLGHPMPDKPRVDTLVHGLCDPAELPPWACSWSAIGAHPCGLG